MIFFGLKIQTPVDREISRKNNLDAGEGNDAVKMPARQEAFVDLCEKKKIDAEKALHMRAAYAHAFQFIDDQQNGKAGQQAESPALADRIERRPGFRSVRGRAPGPFEGHRALRFGLEKRFHFCVCRLAHAPPA